MKIIARLPIALLALVFVSANAAESNFVEEVRKHELQLQDCYNSEEFYKDPAICLKFWIDRDDAHIYDVMKYKTDDPARPGEFSGAAFREHFIKLGQQAPGKVKFVNMKIYADNKYAFVIYYQHLVGKDKAGKAFDFYMQTTDGLEKVKGAWYVVHSHMSLPMDESAFEKMFVEN
ncbi:MAG: nuclear transport factor 2 family protein [Steroidobacteraceae bacterium]